MKIRVESPYLIVLLGFLATIAFGTLMLILPFAQVNQTWGSLLDALFTSTSAVAVTGLSVVNISATYTMFGQSVIIVLMLLGGLGIVTIFSFFSIILGRKIGIMDRYILKEALNLSTMSGALKFVKRVIAIASVFILIGTILYSFVFMPEFGFFNGLFQALFLSVSAFNNAGFDLFSNSLIAYANHPLILTTTMFLIISGGLGFLVWIELFKKKFVLSKLSTYARVVLMMTLILTIVGALGLWITEINGTQSIPLASALFTSVSARTAGLTVLNIHDLTTASKFLIIALMFIGANPISTGGGIKTTTTFIILLSIIALFSGKKVHAFERTFSLESILKSFAIVIISILLMTLTVITIEVLEHGNPLHVGDVKTATAILFEVVSAFGTVGFSEGITPFLTAPSKVIIMVIMLLGRIGPIAAISVFSEKLSWTQSGTIDYMEATVPVG